MTSDPPDIVVLGDCGVDIYARVTRLPAYDEKVPADLLGLYGGGVAANFACAASRFDSRVRLVATVGDDALGTLAVSSVAEFGVDVGQIQVLDGVGTSFCFVALDHTGEKALTIVRTPTFFPSPEHIDLAALLGGRALHLAPFDLGVAADVAEEAQRRGVVVTADLEPGMLSAGTADLERLLAHTTLAMPNQLFLDTIFAGLTPGEAARQLLTRGPRAVVATLGANGAIVAREERLTLIPAVPATVVDTTGAGDSFNAALVCSWLAGDTLEEAAAIAAAAASLSISAYGARSALPDRDQAALLASAAKPKSIADA